VYTINPGGSGPFNAYCEIIKSGADAGGWTLVLKMDGTKPTFAYDAAYWTDSNTQGTSADLDQSEAKLKSFFTVPVTSLRVGMYYGAQYHWLRLDNVGNGTGTFKDLAGSNKTTSAGSAAWKALLSGAQFQANDCSEGFNLTGYDFKLRLGFMADNASTCSLPDSYIGFGGPTIGSVMGGAAPTCGNYWNWSGTYVDKPAWGYILVK
jgi:hypothetical protein